MNWVTATWSALIGACAAMAFPHLVIGLWQRRAANLFFVLAATAVIGIAFLESFMMRAVSVEQFARAQQWTHVPIFLLGVALVGFVQSYFRSGRLWLGLTAIGLRCSALLINFAFPPSLNFSEISALRQVDFLGTSVSAPVGVLSRWTHLSEISSLVLLVYVVDASISAWRRGTVRSRQRAIIVGGSIAVFILVAASTSALVHRQIIPAPYMISFPFAAILVAMACELGSDLFRAGQVAQLKASEESLHAIEERVALAAEAAQFGVWELDVATNRVWLSEKVREIYRIQPEVLTYEAFQERVHPDNRATRHALIQSAIHSGGSYEMEYRIVLPDGTLRWIGARAHCISDSKGKARRLLAVSMDVTERKQAEELFRLATEASPSGTVLVDDRGQIVLVNAHIERLFGYRRDELIGCPIEILVPDRFKGLHLRHRDGFLNDPETKGMGAGRELFARHKDGSEFPVEIGLNRIEAPQGTLVFASVVDLSARKAAEEEARSRREQIELLSRVSLLGEMTASLAHELNQPLSAMETNASAGMRFIDKGQVDPDQLREIMVDVQADARRAHDIIQSVRDGIKKGTKVRTSLNLNEVVKNVMHMVQPDAVAHSCRVEVSLANHLPPIEADPTQIQQVLINLLTNAFDAMEDAPSDRRSVQIATEYDGNGTVCVGVRDHGPGIPDSARKRLFEQFFTTKEDGLGMGLAIVRSVVEAHGGTVRAENVDGGGAGFYLHLPAINGEHV
jgi:two-component system sensor kinase FixL